MRACLEETESDLYDESGYARYTIRVVQAGVDGHRHDVVAKASGSE